MFIPQLSCLRALLLKTSENGFGARIHEVPLLRNNPATAFFLMVSMYALAPEKGFDEDAARGRSWAGTSSCSCVSTVFAFPGAVVAPGGSHTIGKAVRADWSSSGDVDNRARLANLDVNCRRVPPILVEVFRLVGTAAFALANRPFLITISLTTGGSFGLGTSLAFLEAC